MRDYRIPWHLLPTPPAPVLRGLYAGQVLTQRRLHWFLWVDLFFILQGLFQAIDASGSGSEVPYRVFVFVVLVPNLVLGLPVLSGVLALERRAGSLDLALSVPSTEWFVLRRVLPISFVLIAQSVPLLLLVPYGNLWVKLGAMAQAASLTTLVASIVLFWAVRLRTTGAVMVSSLLTVAAFSKWVFANPFPATGRASDLVERFLRIPLSLWTWGFNLAVVSGAAAILYLYARQRLQRPETLL